MDGVIVASLITIGAVLVIFVYLGYYAYRHLRQDDEKAALKAATKRAEKPRA